MYRTKGYGPHLDGRFNMWVGRPHSDSRWDHVVIRKRNGRYTFYVVTRCGKHIHGRETSTSLRALISRVTANLFGYVELNWRGSNY